MQQLTYKHIYIFFKFHFHLYGCCVKLETLLIKIALMVAPFLEPVLLLQTACMHILFMLNARRYTILHDPQCIRLAILLPTVDNSENEFTQFDGSVGKNEISNNKSFDQFSKWQLDDGLSLFSIFFSGTHFKRVMVPFVFCANSCTLNGVFCKCLALNHGKNTFFSV